MTVLQSFAPRTRAAESDLVHSPFFPADVHEGEPVVATIRSRAHGDEQEMRVWRISPFGIELVLTPDGATTTHPLVTGGEIDLVLHLGGQTSEFQGLVVTSRHREHGKDLIGIRWHQTAQTTARITDRRAADRWLCGAEFMPTGVAPNPVRFGDFIHFRVKDISATGMQLVMSLRNKFLVPGMVLDSTIDCPTIGRAKIELKIAHARIISENGKDYLALGVVLHKPGGHAMQVFGQYILQFGPQVSIDDLRRAGFGVHSSTKAVDFSYVRTEEEYRDVLTLRARAYGEAGKIAADAPPEAMADIYDSRARILIAKYKGQVVASLRLIYHGPHDAMEHEEFIQLPDSFPRKDEIIEITRVCTHPDFRRGDLLFGLFKHTMLTALQSRRRYIIGSATRKLLPIYTRVGFKATDVTFQHTAVGGDEHVLFIGDTVGALEGEVMGPVLWNVFFDDMLEYIDVPSIIDMNPLTRIRLGIYRSLAPLSRVLAHRMRKPRRR